MHIEPFRGGLVSPEGLHRSGDLPPREFIRRGSGPEDLLAPEVSPAEKNSMGDSTPFGKTLDPTDFRRIFSRLERPEWASKWTTYRHQGYRHVADVKLTDVFSDLRLKDGRAVREYVAEYPDLARLHIEDWRTASPPSLKELAELLRLSKEPLPGGEVELGIFLEPISFLGARHSILDAWNGRPHTEVSGKDSIDAYLAGHKGKTLIVVSHIEESNFVMRDGEGHLRDWLPVPKFVEQAQAHGVFLVPIGCGSGRAGAPFGFAKNISTDQVSTILRALPRENPTIGDLLVSLRQAGSTLEFDFPRARDVFELAVTDNPNDAANIRIKIPRYYGNPAQTTTSSPLGVNQTNSPILSTTEATQLEQMELGIREKAALYAPWWERGKFGTAIAWIDALPWLLIFVSGVAVGIFDVGLFKLATLRWFYRTRNRTKFALKVLKAVRVLGFTSVGLLLSATIYSFFWNVYFGIFIVVMFLYLFLVDHDQVPRKASQ